MRWLTSQPAIPNWFNSRKNESSKIINVDSASIPTLCFQGLATFFSPVCCVYVATKLKATLRTFCADAVLAPREDRHVSSPSDCFFGYHSSFASTRHVGYGYWMPLHGLSFGCGYIPEGLRPTAPHLFYSAWWIFTRTSLWMGEDLNLSGVPTVFPISPLCEPTYFTLIPSIYSLSSRTGWFCINFFADIFLNVFPLKNRNMKCL